MTCQTNTRERILTILVEHTMLERDSFNPDAKLMDELGHDSLDVVEIAMACEDAFGITLPDDQVADVVTVADLIKLVESAL